MNREVCLVLRLQVVLVLAHVLTVEFGVTGARVRDRVHSSDELHSKIPNQIQTNAFIIQLRRVVYEQPNVMAPARQDSFTSRVVPSEIHKLTDSVEVLADAVMERHDRLYS
jgi:hypothetical protein